MSEKQIEQALVKAVKSAGGLCLKWVSPGWDGAPDRIVLFGDSYIGRIAFVEVKAPGGKVRKIQRVRHQQLRKLGFKVFVLDDPNYIPMIIEEIFLMFKLVLEKAEEPEIKLPTSAGSSKKQESSLRQNFSDKLL